MPAPLPAPPASPQPPGQVALGVYNWLASSSVAVAYMKTQCSMLGLIIAADKQSLHCVLLPQFTWQKGQLLLAQQLCLKQLQGARANLDHSFYVPLAQKADMRDSRPLNISGRLALPMDLPDGMGGYVWKNASLLRSGRTAEAAQVRNAEMVQMLEMEDGLPIPSKASDAFSHHNGPQGARRYEQYGVAAALANYFLTRALLLPSPAPIPCLTSYECTPPQHPVYLPSALLPQCLPKCRPLLPLAPLLPHRSPLPYNLCALSGPVPCPSHAPLVLFFASIRTRCPDRSAPPPACLPCLPPN